LIIDNQYNDKTIAKNRNKRAEILWLANENRAGEAPTLNGHQGKGNEKDCGNHEIREYSRLWETMGS